MLGWSLSLLEWLGVTALGLGAVVLLFSPYRHWLAFMLAGMLYFSLLEAVRHLSQSLFAVSTLEGYLTGVVLSLLGLATWLALTEPQRHARREMQRIARQIEHRPIECRDL